MAQLTSYISGFFLSISHYWAHLVEGLTTPPPPLCLFWCLSAPCSLKTYIYKNLDNVSLVMGQASVKPELFPRWLLNSPHTYFTSFLEMLVFLRIKLLNQTFELVFLWGLFLQLNWTQLPNSTFIYLFIWVYLLRLIVIPSTCCLSYHLIVKPSTQYP